MTRESDNQIEVFLSYAREDRPRAKSLALRLEQRGFSVWWDWNLVGGQDFRSEIRTNIARAQKVVVLWSEASTSSHFVIDEANLAKDLGKLVPLRLDDVEPPLGFGALHTIHYRETESDFADLCAALAGNSPAPLVVGPSRRRLIKGSLAVLGLGTLGLGTKQAWDWIEPRMKQGPTVPRLALVIGNNDYREVPSLVNAVNDAKAVTAALQSAGFRVATLVNADRQQIRDAIHEFKILLSLGGVGLFYYGGHGAHIGGRDIVLPVDAKEFSSPDDFEDRGIDISEVSAPINSFFSAIPHTVQTAGLCLAPSTAEECSTPWKSDVAPDNRSKSLVDAPENDPFADIRVVEASKSQTDHGVTLVYAADRGEVALDGAGSNSPFATALLEELPKGDGNAVSVAKRMRVRVKSMTNSIQNPVLEDKSHVEFLFNRPEFDPRDGVLRLVFLDCCRDNPFAVTGVYRR